MDDEPPASLFAEEFATLRSDPELAAERERLAGLLAAEPDKTLAFVAEMEMDAPEGAELYACPMHPEIVRRAPSAAPSAG